MRLSPSCALVLAFALVWAGGAWGQAETESEAEAESESESETEFETETEAEDGDEAVSDAPTGSELPVPPGLGGDFGAGSPIESESESESEHESESELTTVPLARDQEVTTVPLASDQEVTTVPLAADQEATAEPLVRDQEAATNEGLAATADRSSSRSRLLVGGLVGLGLGVAGVAGYYFSASPPPSPQAAGPKPGSSVAPIASASTTTSPSTTRSDSPRTTAPTASATVDVRTVKLHVWPDYAHVTVDGEHTPVEQGFVELRGEVGSVHEVVLHADGQTKAVEVSVTEKGAVPPAVFGEAPHGGPTRPSTVPPAASDDEPW